MLNRTLTLAFLLLSLSLTVFSAGTQFITGPCTSDADCASSCCGFRSGKCAGPVIAQERDGGCGFGDAQPNRKAADAFLSGMSAQNSNNAAGTTMKAVPTSSASTGNMNSNTGGSSSGNSGTPGSSAPATPGTQFITGVCRSDADCASKCCGFKSGKCAGPIIAQERDGGCGFGDAQPNANAANALRGAGRFARDLIQ